MKAQNQPSEDNQQNNQNNGSLHGRAATSLRPGLLIKSVLMGRTPTRDGQYVTEASITDIHNAYKTRLRYENALRHEQGKRPLRGMNLHSFMTLFKFARILGLVEFVRDEPRNYEYGELYRVENGTGFHVVVSTRKIYRLSAKGREDTISWNNLCGAWYQEHPRKAEVAP